MANTNELSAYERLEEALDNLWTQEAFLDFLAFQKCVYSYSWNNRLLIWTQRPDARLLFGYQRWKTFGRWVMKGEKAIGIIQPVAFKTEEKGEEVTHTRFKWNNCLYDISQTDGKDLPDIPVPSLPDVGGDGLFQIMRRVSEEQFSVPVTIQKTSGSYGYYTKTKTITISEEQATGIQAVATLSHELAHHLTPQLWDLPRDEAEVIAEVAAFSVMSYFNIDISQQAVPYIATWGQSKELFLKGMPVAQTITSQLIDAISKETTCQTQSPQGTPSSEAYSPIAVSA